LAGEWKLLLKATSLVDFQSQLWNRKIVKNYWFVVGMSIVVELVSLAVSNMSRVTFLVHYVIIPTLLLITVGLITEWVVRRAKRRPDYAVLVSGELMAAIIVGTHPTVPATCAIFVLPTLVSVVYFEVRKVLFTTALSFASILVLYFGDTTFRATVSMIEIISLCAIVLGGCYVAIEIMQRSIELSNHLQTTLESNERLRIQNILMESASKLDGLTETYNHKTFHEHLEELIQRSEALGATIHLLLIDIDDFKQVNDRYGHRVGDVILRGVAALIQSQLTPNDFLARYGGEEFTVVMVGRSFEDTLDTAELIRASVADALHEEVDNKPVTVSIGLSQYAPGKGKETFFAEADESLYCAKRYGKNQVQSHKGIVPADVDASLV
jgi:diguanylate cyclase